MSKWILAAFALFLGVAWIIPDAEARRLGGARSIGAQRNVTTPPAATPAKPAQQQAGAAAPAAAKPAAGLAKWFPLLGGLALGGMLGWLLASNGGSFLLLAMLAIATVLIFRALARRAVPEQTMQYAGGGRDAVRMPEAAAGSLLATASAVPAGFDTAAFLRGARINFARLQVANDRGDLDDIREFTTPELFEALASDLRERGGAAQQTEVSQLDAQLLEVATEAGRHWASVRFSGMVREAPGAQAEPFQEVWNLAKPVDGSSGWLLAGIQQVN
jgi:predicted lipid-binding transport protein (Tim44 family)